MFFSKALFKQSMKANWVKWLSVTLATCVMLAIVIIVLGSLSINNIRDSLKNVFAQADQESVLKENAIDSYDAYLSSVEFENGVVQLTNMWEISLGEGQPTIKTAIVGTYEQNKALYINENGVQPEGEALNEIQWASANQVSEQLLGVAGAMLGNVTQEDLSQLMYILISTYQYDAEGFNSSGAVLYSSINNQYFNYVYNVAYQQSIAVEGQTDKEAEQVALEAQALAKKGVSAYTNSGLNPFTFNIDSFKADAQTYINDMIYLNVYSRFQITDDSTDEQKEEAEQYAFASKVISNTALSTYELWLEQGATVEQAKINATGSISDQIDDEKVVEALQELGNMDIYGLIIGSIFYRIAGLLLPMVYVIMVANGLLAGQVDSGSMAYVLSTPTKRRTVSTTQMLYLLVSLLAMFALVTAVSVVSIWIVGGNSFAINFGEILLFNLGAFLTMFAFAGFCFMCSAIFNRTKYSLSIGGGISIFMLVCTILGLFGSNVVPSAMRIEQMNFFNYLSLISLFDTTKILAGGLNFLIGFGVLAVVGVITFVIGTFVFDRKDLPL